MVCLIWVHRNPIVRISSLQLHTSARKIHTNYAQITHACTQITYKLHTRTHKLHTSACHKNRIKVPQSSDCHSCVVTLCCVWFLAWFDNLYRSTINLCKRLQHPLTSDLITSALSQNFGKMMSMFNTNTFRNTFPFGFCMTTNLSHEIFEHYNIR